MREGKFSTSLTSKKKLSSLKRLRKKRQALAIGEEPLGEMKGNDIELYLDVQRPYPPMLRGPPYPGSLETRKEIEKHINGPLDMDVIRKIGHNEIVEITTPVPITWHDGKSRLFGYSRDLNNYTKADRLKLLRIIFHMGIYEYTRMPFVIKNAPAHLQRMMDTIFQDVILEGWIAVYIVDIIIYSETWEDHVQYMD
ncbi:hypothetical protein O181_029594 [Austropuccinia psidii MF-1]|uniref:Reverse transcriptase domain-containing protein n=1 Tax=Austropuccinia psidii MF-1 TaxID=1389203 RepID=A0A9Q3H4Q2_9BASI|nr:hypothetical protein [Austropuccinia psidii MF-1]